jgi:cyclopropane fatty-acyl-phospholipid synthase-like methyltransferase
MTASDRTPVAVHPQAVHTDDPPVWPIERMRVSDSLWGDGYIFPEGEAEILRLARPFGLSAVSSLLLLGAGGGGPVCSLSRGFGTRITGYERDPDLAVVATERVIRANMARRARIESWDPSQPDFAPTIYHHCLALQPLSGARSEPLFAALAAALKPGGQLMLVELVSDAALDPKDPAVAEWALMERRPASGLAPEVSITRALGRLGFDIRGVQDMSTQHVQQALFGWRRRIRDLETVLPRAREARCLVREAELWLLRTRLFREGKLRLMHWHAVRR